MAAKGECIGIRFDNTARMAGRLGKNKAGDFEAAEIVSGGVYYASP